MNKVILCGRLTADPETKTGQTQTGEYVVTRFSVAVDRRFKREGEKDADFFSCTAFAKTASFIGKYFSKGKRILVVGRIENDEYTAKDGTNVKTNRVIVEEAEFADGKEKIEERPAADFVDVPDNVASNMPF